MGRAIDTLHKAFNDIIAKPDLILDETFMMNTFKEYRDKLPPFQEYYELIFEKTQMSVINRKSGTKVVQFAQVRS